MNERGERAQRGVKGRRAAEKRQLRPGTYVEAPDKLTVGQNANADK
jgi:hypothetical protein